MFACLVFGVFGLKFFCFSIVSTEKRTKCFKKVVIIR